MGLHKLAAQIAEEIANTLDPDWEQVIFLTLQWLKEKGMLKDAEGN